MRSLTTVLLLSLLMGTPRAEAQDRIEVTGCPAPGVEHNCLILKTEAGSYDISSARPRPKIGDRKIKLSGTKTEKLGICQQGVILENIRWRYIEQKCQ